MANTGFTWGSWAYAQRSAADWDGDTPADDVADAATLTSDVITLTAKAGCEIGITLVEDNTGAIDGVVTVRILRQAGTGPVYEQTDGTGSPWSFTITPVQNDTIYKSFFLDPRMVGPFKVSIENQAGQTLTTTVEYRTCDVPAAS